jgi:hypothetical protein
MTPYDPYAAGFKVAHGNFALRNRPPQYPARTTGVGFWRRQTSVPVSGFAAPQPQTIDMKKITQRITPERASVTVPAPPKGSKAWLGPEVVYP